MDMLKWNKRERQVETLSLKNMLDEIFQKKLLFLLPFYIMRYEKIKEN